MNRNYFFYNVQSAEFLSVQLSAKAPLCTGDNKTAAVALIVVAPAPRALMLNEIAVVFLSVRPTMLSTPFYLS